MSRIEQTIGASCLAAAVVLLALPRTAAPAGASIERVRIDLSRDPEFRLRALDGMGAEVARRIVETRSGLRIDSPVALLSVRGIGTTLLHRWHEDLAFSGDLP